MDGSARAVDLGTFAGIGCPSVPRRLAQFCIQFAVNLVAIFTNSVGVSIGLKCRYDSATGFVQMAAVVKPAILNMRPKIGHIGSQLGRINVVQTELLKSGRVNQRRGLGAVHPVPGCARGGVFA